jgi:hypothetical protein
MKELYDKEDQSDQEYDRYCKQRKVCPAIECRLSETERLLLTKVEKLKSTLDARESKSVASGQRSSSGRPHVPKMLMSNQAVSRGAGLGGISTPFGVTPSIAGAGAVRRLALVPTFLGS